ncbi:hypothetical protein L202_06883 [Cryptococcus amylolentus CBS 6039]|uniref:Mid2 domain-containing protein n=1 Tax=Cryptococcus amylolentus CBS 6039 TaxID=1295533 RepID=A0A1E3HFH1_9TREE|nr:hypothetical protein L202_06883 [Cryptococcus amylolentus CBS 6039]ODN74506.1 hypothetical protein L202_06883 [Cryptococcus amylolentus CBS 6039]
MGRASSKRLMATRGLSLGIILLSDIVAAKSAEYAGKNRGIDTASLKDRGFISTGVLAADTSIMATSAAASDTIASISSIAQETTLTSQDPTRSILSNTNPTSAVTSEAETTASLPSLTTASDGTLHWQSEIVSEADATSDGAQEATTALATSTAGALTSSASPLNDEPHTSNNEETSESLQQASTTTAPSSLASTSHGESTVVIAVTDPGSGSSSSVLSVSDVALSGQVSQTMLSSGVLAFDENSSSGLGSAQSSTVRASTHATSRSVALDFGDATASSLSSQSVSTTSSRVSGTASKSSSIDGGGVIAAEVDSTTSSTSSKNTASDYNLAGSSKSTASAQKSSSDALSESSSAATASAQSSATSDIFVTSGTTLTGQAAVAALASETSTVSTSGSSKASADSDSDTKEDSSSLSSIAIVGIVGGVLVGLIAIYLIWYQWRKKKARASLGDQIPDDPEEDDYDEKHRQTRSSFGADEPFTPATYRQRGRGASRQGSRDRDWETGYGETMYDRQTYWDEDGHERMTEYDGRGYCPQSEYLQDYDRKGGGGDGRTEYGLTQYGDGMTAALADGMVTHALTAPSQAGSAQNPFVPVPPVPRVPSVYSTHKNSTVRTNADGLDVPHSVAAQSAGQGQGQETAYGTSIYDAYGGPDSRPQTQSTEPSTSNLLPWLNKGSQTPAPPVPAVDAQYSHRVPSPPRQGSPPQASVQQRQQMINLEDEYEPRAPPRAVMAQTPLPMAQNIPFDGGLEQAPIPTFR